MMARYFIYILIFIIGFINQSNAKNEPYVKLSHFNFYHPEQGSYTETVLLFQGNSLKAKKSDSNYELELVVIQIFKRDDDIIQVDKSAVNAPIDSLGNVRDFYHIRKFPIDPGKYDYELIVEDPNNKHKTLNYEKAVNIALTKTDYYFSEIVPANYIEKSNENYPTDFTKFGYEVYPKIEADFKAFQNELFYYAELNCQLYETKDTTFVLAEKLIYNESDSLVFERYSRVSMNKLKPIAKNINLDTIYSGDYTLELTLLDRNKEIVSTKSMNFKREKRKPIKLETIKDTDLKHKFETSIPLDSSAYYVSSLIPIAHQNEVKNIITILKQENNLLNLKYLQSFWKAVAPEEPYESWLNFKAVVDKIEERYGTSFQMGHETDRGRVYLQYGSPSQVYDVPSSPSEYPYEIWQYDRIKNLTNRRFVFYNTTNLTNNYVLLHSDMIGEIQNKRWRYALNKRNSFDNDLDDPVGTGNTDHWGRNSDLYFNSY